MKIKCVFLFIVLLAMAGTAGATDYYVATWGNNTSAGTLAAPWQNISNATQRATAGDTIYLIDGNWSWGEKAVFSNSGNSTNPITLTVYNGTPTMYSSLASETDIALSVSSKAYINISGLTIKGYRYSIEVSGSNNTHIRNNTIYTYNGTQSNKGIRFHSNSSFSTAKNNTMIGAGWNSFGVGSVNADEATNNISFLSNTVLNNNGSSCSVDAHSGIDLSGNVADINIIGNSFTNIQCNAIYAHDQTDIRRVNISNNILTNIANGIHFEHAVSDSIVHNNTFLNTSESLWTPAHYIQWGNRADSLWSFNVTFSNNTARGNMVSSQQMVHIVGNGTVYQNNDVKSDFGDTEYVVEAYGNDVNTTYLDERNNISSGSFKIQMVAAGYILRFTNGMMFSENQAGSPAYYANGSWYSFAGTATTTVIPYPNMTIVPFQNYVTASNTSTALLVNYSSNLVLRLNITIDKTSSFNLSGLTQSNYSKYYSNGTYIESVTASSNMANFSSVPVGSYYITEETTIIYSPPSPVWILNRTGSTWVNHSWQAGIGNVTDSYNISQNGTWFNGTTDTFFNSTIVVGNWSNITIWAFNNSGGLSATSISNNSQVPAFTSTSATNTSWNTLEDNVSTNWASWSATFSIAVLASIVLIIILIMKSDFEIDNFKTLITATIVIVVLVVLFVIVSVIGYNINVIYYSMVR